MFMCCLVFETCPHFGGFAPHLRFFFYMDTQYHAMYHVWILYIPTTLFPRREKTSWSELESNPGPLASQATALTTRPWLLGLLT